jgi:hypothetical protein
MDKIRDKSKSNLKQPPLYKFASLVNLVGNFFEDEGFPALEKIVPIANSVTAQSYPYFGGVDIGPKEAKRGRKPKAE